MENIPGFMEGLRQAELAGHGFTGMEDGTVVGVGGIRRYWDGVGEAWAIYPRDSKRYGRDIIRFTRVGLDRIEQAFGYRRVQAVARKDWVAAVRFLLALRFRVDALLEKYGPDGSDYYLMARIH